jgi:peptidoglycan/xylan/chitin deacetylase (PgdA/CDA1 family)
VKAHRRLIDAAARLAFPAPDPTRRSVILCYHSIHPSAPYASATPTEFERHLDWLQDNCDLVPLELIRDADARERPRVALTFDDGFLDNFDYALPTLRARGLTATFFLTLGFVEREPAVIARMAQLWQTTPREMWPLRWKEVHDMHLAGMAFGSHTVTHPNLVTLEAARARWEMQESKRRLEDRLDAPITSLAYPFGKLRHHVAPLTVELARACGYERAVSTLGRAIVDADDDLCLPRLVIGNDSVPQLHAKVVGAIDWHARVRAHLPRALSERSLPVRH